MYDNNDERDEAENACRDLDREQIVQLLENVGIQCYDSESTDTLREALIVNIIDGTIEIDALTE